MKGETEIDICSRKSCLSVGCYEFVTYPTRSLDYWIAASLQVPMLA